MTNISISEYEREYEEMKMILRGLAHEMGNALTVMGHSIYIFGKNESIKESDNWQNLNDDYKYICRLFKNLTEYNHSREVDLKKIDLNELLKKVKNGYICDGFKMNYQEKADSYIIGDDVKLKQVFMNIINNAIDAIKGKENGKIDIMVDQDTCNYYVEIKDNGCGIEKDSISKIFDPLYTKGKENGTGFGLYICKRIIEGHSGSITVESEKGIGTKFVIQIKKA